MYPYIFGIDSYILMMILGYIIAFFGIVFANRKHRQYQLPIKEIIFLSVFIIFGVLCGSRLLFILTNATEIKNFEAFLDMLFDGGFVFYGGVIGGVLTGLLYCKLYRLNPLRYADIIICFLPLGHAIGRIGCFLAGCCYGSQTTSWLGVKFPALSQPAYDLNHGEAVTVYPTQLFESIFLFILFGGLVTYFVMKKTHRPLFITGLYLVLYGVWRFVIEFLRGDEIRGIYILSTSQWISIACVIIGALLISPRMTKIINSKSKLQKEA